MSGLECCQHVKPSNKIWLGLLRDREQERESGREREREGAGICTIWAYGSLFVRFGPFSHSVTPTGLLNELVLLVVQNYTQTQWRTRTETRTLALVDTCLRAKAWLCCFTVCYCSQGLNEVTKLFQSTLLTNMCDPWLTPVWPPRANGGPCQFRTVYSLQGFSWPSTMNWW